MTDLGSNLVRTKSLAFLGALGHNRVEVAPGLAEGDFDDGGPRNAVRRHLERYILEFVVMVHNSNLG